MKIISHRGYWKSEAEKNQEPAFRRSFKLGFGTETDLRDLNGQIVISHDAPLSAQNPLTLRNLLMIYREYEGDLPLLLNIKADGLQGGILEHLEEFSVENYYLFDMSVPDMLVSARAGLNCLTRHSDIETSPHYYPGAKGVWMDELVEEWIVEHDLRAHVDSRKRVFIVSPELHKRPHLQKWQQYKSMDPAIVSSCTLCTDLPEAASAFFS